MTRPLPPHTLQRRWIWIRLTNSYKPIAKGNTPTAEPTQICHSGIWSGEGTYWVVVVVAAAATATASAAWAAGATTAASAAANAAAAAAPPGAMGLGVTGAGEGLEVVEERRTRVAEVLTSGVCGLGNRW
jgi:hypothetical protein